MKKTITFQVEGVMCGNCVKKIETEVGALKGVEGVRVGDDFSNTSIEYTESVISTEEIICCIEGISGKNFRVKKQF